LCALVSTDDNPHTGGRAAVSLAPAMAGKINIIYLFIYLFIYSYGDYLFAIPMAIYQELSENP